MRQGTHILSGAVLTQTYLTWLGVPMELGYFAHPIVLAAAVPAAGACLAGSIFPDVDIRIPFLGHRTLTHWPLPFILGLYLSWLLTLPYLFLFCLGTLLHITLDSFTRMGIPLFKPFGKRYGWRLVTTGGMGEVVFIFGLFGCGFGLWKYFA